MKKIIELLNCLPDELKRAYQNNFITYLQAQERQVVSYTF